VKQIGATELRELPPAAPERTISHRLRAAAAGFWLQLLFFFAQRLPWFARAARAPFVFLAIRFSPAIRCGTEANARRILPASATALDIRRFTRGVVASFYDFVCDVGRSLRLNPADLVARIERIEGHDKYVAARALKKGAILLTAHMGSFEVAVAALLAHEKRIHVVFKRDVGRFERIRQTLRQRLGVVEQPVDDGWGIWMRLRDALREDEVVAIQGDRVMPGQKGRRMPFLGGHLLLPSGPVKLATASGAPIIPVFSIRTPDGRIRLFIEDAIIVGDDIDLAMDQIATVIAKYVAAYPQQWLVLHPAFCEDAPQPTEEKV
jgi:phosphatidylinositol dimannoside acyltransferase